jgi:PAS domain S-box-containing protein
MKASIAKSLTLKWMVFPTLLATIPLIIAGFSSIVEIYHEDWKRSFITIEGTVLIVGILFSLFLTKKLTLPIKRLSKEMEEVAKGNWDTRIEPATKDEVGVLTESFNHMVQVLKQSKGALKEAEGKYRTILENIEDGYYETDLAGNFTFLNHSMCRIFGYPKVELIGMNDRQYTDKENAKRLFQAFNQVYRTGEPGRGCDWEIIRKDGTKRYIEASISLRKDSSGKPIGFGGIIRDITDHKQAEEALRRSEERYRTILENIQDGYFEVDLTGKFTLVNDAECRNLGYPRDELIGMNNRQYTDEATAKKLYQAFNGVYRTGEPVKGLDYQVIRKDGTKVFSEISVSLMRDSEGKPIGFRGITRDITERKRMEEALRQSEEQYRTILENMQEGYLEVDLAGNFTFVNNAQCRNLGYTREELMGMSYQRYTDEKNARELYQAFNGVYRTGEPVKVLDVEVIRKDGTKVFNEISVSLIRDSEGKPIGFRGISRDITERKRMEEQLLQAEKLRAVGEMASGVAHDFNNALAAILGNTQLMLYSVRDEEFKESLQTIEKVAKDSAQTVRRLQDFTRRKVHQEHYKLNVNSIVKDAIGITKPRWKDEAQGKGIRIEMVSHCEEIPPVAGSASELREVMTNLVFNAVEAMPEGGVIEIRTFQRDEKVCIQISDTGIGIKEEVRKKIFEPFFTTKPFSNTGLGLSMAYGVIKRMRGDIDVESEVGKGTTFTISLPICFEAMEEATSLPSSPPVIQKKKEVRILVIDDEESVRSVLSRILTRVKYQVNVAKDGEEGIRLFNEQAFDIVLTDLGMPGMSGWDVCRAIKKMNPRTPVGMITGWGMEIGEERMKEVELDFLISKPFDSNQILNTVAKTMESKEM